VPTILGKHMVVANMEEQIKMLVELQELDKEIFEKKHILESMPVKIKELDVALESKTSSLKSLEEEYKAVQLKRKEKEVELQAKEQTIKKYQTQLFQVKTNKEYSSLEKEIASIKADNSLLEEEILNLFDETDQVQKKRSKEKEAFEGEKKNTEAEKKKINDEKKANEEELARLNDQRKGFANKVDKSILSKYDKILNNRSGVAMVPIVGGTCGGCNMNLPPQVENEARMKKNLIFCGNCSRILYSTE